MFALGNGILYLQQVTIRLQSANVKGSSGDALIQRALQPTRYHSGGIVHGAGQCSCFPRGGCTSGKCSFAGLGCVCKVGQCCCPVALCKIVCLFLVGFGMWVPLQKQDVTKVDCGGSVGYQKAAKGWPKTAKGPKIGPLEEF